jgi:hypothetical protein
VTDALHLDQNKGQYEVTVRRVAAVAGWILIVAGGAIWLWPTIGKWDIAGFPVLVVGVVLAVHGIKPPPSV